MIPFYYGTSGCAMAKSYGSGSAALTSATCGAGTIFVPVTERGELYFGLGVNGCGKSALLAVLGNREVPIQDHIDIYYLGQDIVVPTVHR